MLVLFDIDGTLVLTQHAGTRSMHAAAREMFGESLTFEDVEVAGRIDPLIWADMARIIGIEDHEAHHDRFRAGYARHLARRLAENNTAVVLPGVRELLEALTRLEGVTLGLLTGNYPETGTLKIEAAGLDPAGFAVAAWGSDGESRRDLPSFAMTRYREQTGLDLQGHEVVVIGDTPYDVACARAHGCRAIAVATGSFSRETLAGHEPDLLVENLSETSAIVDWITGTAEPPSSQESP